MLPVLRFFGVDGLLVKLLAAYDRDVEGTAFFFEVSFGRAVFRKLEENALTLHGLSYSDKIEQLESLTTHLELFWPGLHL